MKKFRCVFLLAAMLFLSACTAYKPIVVSNIKSVHVLFTDTTWAHHQGYELFDGTHVTWGKKNLDIKRALLNYQDKINTLPQKSTAYIYKIMAGTKHYTYRPIKVTPPNEFGYLQTLDGKIIFYGIMGSRLLDFSGNKIYY